MPSPCPPPSLPSLPPAPSAPAGMPTVVPPLPGVTPATTRVPYSRQARAWKVPSLPVMPCTTRRVSPFNQIAISGPLSPGRPRHLLGGVRHVLGDNEVERRLAQHLAPLLDIGALEPYHHRQADGAQLLDRPHDAARDAVGAGDAAAG